MTTDLSKVHFEGASIVRVIEEAAQQTLTLELSYPLADGASDFPRRRLVFLDYSRYLVDERGIPGEPIIRRVEIAKTDIRQITIRMHTNHGVRELTCVPDVFVESL